MGDSLREDFNHAVEQFVAIAFGLVEAVVVLLVAAVVTRALRRRVNRRLAATLAPENAKQLAENGLTAANLTFDDAALVHLIRAHTREAGLRNLEREIGRVCRKVARQLTEGRTEPVVCTPERVREYLGPDRFFSEVADRTEERGVAVGLAWTPNGGDILFIEATRMAGKKGLTLTGHLGEVMKESAQAALSWVRSRSERHRSSGDGRIRGRRTS